MFLKRSLALTLILAFAHTNFLDAGWFGKAVQAAFWPCYPLYETAEYLRKLPEVFAKPKDKNQLIKMQYPHAVAYVETELTRAGLNPSHILMINNSDPSIITSQLYYPFDALEQHLITGNSSHELRGTVAHEIGHLIHKDGYKEAFFPLVAWGIVELAARNLPTWCKLPTWHGANKIIRSLTKTGACYLVIKALEHMDEYRADTFEIKRFAREPEVLNAESISFVDHHKSIIRAHFREAPFFTEKLGVSLWFWRLAHAIKERHPTSISRAVRFAHAAGKNITQKEVAQKTYAEVFCKSKPTEK